MLKNRYVLGGLVLVIAAVIIPFAVSGESEYTQEEINLIVLNHEDEIAALNDEVQQLQNIITMLQDELQAKGADISILEAQNQDLDARLQVIENALEGSTLLMTEEEILAREKLLDQSDQVTYQTYNYETGQWETIDPEVDIGP